VLACSAEPEPIRWSLLVLL